MDLKKEVKEEFIRFQRNEKTESIVYERLASIEKDESNRKVLRLISAEEKAHYATLKKYTETDVAPDKLRIAKYYWLARILGITFAIKLMSQVKRMHIMIMPNIQIIRTSGNWPMKKKFMNRN